MTVLTFPSNPTEGQIYDAPNGIQYVYDGVKWAGETVTSSSEAVTNSTQDRIAPMFVNGVNNGISFTYDAGTNTMSATVTSTVGSSLSNNNHEFSLESDGTVTLDGDPFVIPTNTNELTNGAGFITSSALTGYATELYVTTRGYITSNGIPSQTGNDGKYLTTDGTTLSWGTVASGTTDRLTNGVSEVVLEADGSIVYPGNIKQSYQDATSCTAGVDTVIYTSTDQYQHAIKLFVMVEGNPDGGSGPWQTQACDIIAVRGYVDNIVHVTTYGITYSSATAFATFDGQWNAISNRIEITCRPVSLINGVTASVHVIEMTSND